MKTKNSLMKMLGVISGLFIVCFVACLFFSYFSRKPVSTVELKDFHSGDTVMYFSPYYSEGQFAVIQANDPARELIALKLLTSEQSFTYHYDSFTKPTSNRKRIVSIN